MYEEAVHAPVAHTFTGHVPAVVHMFVAEIVQFFRAHAPDGGSV
jgi:hypothetical protein